MNNFRMFLFIVAILIGFAFVYCFCFFVIFGMIHEDVWSMFCAILILGSGFVYSRALNVSFSKEKYQLCKFLHLIGDDNELYD